MSINKGDLMAYADGELGANDAARVEAAIAADPALAERLAAERRLRAALRDHLDPVVREPIPDELTAMIAAAAQEREPETDIETDARKIVNLAAARAAREEDATFQPSGLRQQWRSGLAIAASLVLGVVLGTQLHPGGSIVQKDGMLVASGSLSEALENQLASAQDESNELRILTSFQREDGDYCRVFEAVPTSGIACKTGGSWILERTSASTHRQTSEYRQAGSAESALMQAAQEMARGAPLDSAQEEAARSQGWSR